MRSLIPTILLRRVAFDLSKIARGSNIPRLIGFASFTQALFCNFVAIMFLLVKLNVLPNSIVDAEIDTTLLSLFALSGVLCYFCFYSEAKFNAIRGEFERFPAELDKKGRMTTNAYVIATAVFLALSILL